ncbi:MAG TPA: ATP-binding protein [Verrucomicrobiae bacterium]|nr:ATP-binding protein [Verrucomicrobiae bacterium]
MTTAPKPLEPIDGFDPLSADDSAPGSSISSVLEDARKRIIYNILKSYTGYYDIFSELLQNSLDAVQQRQQREGHKFHPRIWVVLDIPAGLVRVVDNGIGMNEREFRYCLRPSVSFKKQADLRGHKGVGATFLAYGFSFLKLQTKQDQGEIAAILRQGRQWAEDNSGTVPRPKFEGAEFSVPELELESSGTSAEIIIGQSPSERPKNLAWIGAQTAEQWYTVLRIKTPLGGVYLTTPPFRPRIHIKVRSAEKSETVFETDRAEYFYPHEFPNLKVQSLRDLTKALDAIPGDARTKFTKLQGDYKRLDCVYDIWDKDEILRDESYFASALDDEKRLLIEKHNVIVYGCFLRSARLWSDLNDEVFLFRKGQRIIHGGLQLATDFMVQGDLSIIPLTSTIGYQANSHVVVHFTDGSPDLGRKVFQPELKDLAEDLSVRAVNTFKRFLQHLKPDTGPNVITPEKELHEWKRRQEDHRDRKPLSFAHDGTRISLVSTPQQEQDVIALFHELVGAGILRGYRFFSTSQNDRYDSLFFMEYTAEDKILFNANTQRLGVNRGYKLPYSTEPKVLEYKYTFDTLVDDFENEEKFAKQIDVVVCWNSGSTYKSKFYLQPLLVGDEGSSREIYGSTHQAFATGSQEPSFEVLVLEDLLNWLQDPSGEEARQKLAYRDI